LDQSFPRNEDELTISATALGELQGCIENNQIHLLMTDVLRDLVEDFDWASSNSRNLLGEIRRMLALLFLQPHNRLVEIGLNDVEAGCPHPVPETMENQGLAEIWADEIGKLLVLHDKCNRGQGFFVGIADELAFADLEGGHYHNPTRQRTFPLVGPDDFGQLSDAYEWEIPSDIRRKPIRFADIKKNIGALGAIRIDEPRRDDHYKALFRHQRSWTFKKLDQIPDRYLKELVPITGYPLDVIKAALITGVPPDPKKRRIKLQI
jgi:hypothetical protein